MLDCQSMRPYINQNRGCVAQLQYITALCFQLFTLDTLGNITNKESVRSAPVSSALTQVLH